jgi:hypothetical protein
MCACIRGRLKEYLRKSLYDCGWHDELKAHCKGACVWVVAVSPAIANYRSTGRADPSAEVIKTKGMEKIEVEDLVREITPHGRGALAISSLRAAWSRWSSAGAYMQDWSLIYGRMCARAAQRRSLTMSRPSCSGKFSSSSPLVRVLRQLERSLRPEPARAVRSVTAAEKWSKVSRCL